jgi:hypothetical protein
MRELHWHPNASEWQYYLAGKGRMTVFTSEGARTMDFNANDVGFVPVSLAKTLGVLSFTPLTMLQACAQAVDFKVGHHFGEGQATVLKGFMADARVARQIVPSLYCSSRFDFAANYCNGGFG